ncbi:translesion error-prone DNA polymerase V autoproteolytic subunit [Luteimonas yindakuii]|uniref:LexA family protein n=1 Tax=Luteimonas yindakuii TaxID=2565782 RepID=UPI0010A4F439|nr:translesion error-prone DNA polymerase V autoproteolytic subunit [Luteimonas yindakuii]QCO66992.1 translesion error-prone DNA polymerase V autoproteolytic subunit [Luteimonas yindakuii]
MLAHRLPNPPTLIGRLAEFSSLALPSLRQRVACGFPSPAEDFFTEEDRLDLNQKLVTNPAATFLAWADTGGSMVDFGIHDGDLLVIDRSIRPRSGHTVLVLWEGGFMVKKLDVRAGRIRLLASQGVQPIVVGEGVELDVWGVVRWSLTKHA